MSAYFLGEVLQKRVTFPRRTQSHKTDMVIARIG
ncbi:hypothetical protein PEC301937_14620 [Pectobacterium carotovorum subsp. carotovorum]|nr:hypothetical protein PEC301937_14620 [Pectobacterium carotovorum subsp. carotovorum]